MSKPTQTRRERVEPGIYKRTAADGADVFEIGFRDAQGKQRWRRVRGGIKVARAELATAHAGRARGERVAADPRLTFGHAADRWWESRALKLRPATQQRYGADLRHLRAVFGRRRLTDVSAADVAAYVTAKQRQGLAGWTVRGHVAVLSAVYAYAGRHLGFPGTNPATLLDRVERPSTDHERDKRILAADELARLLAAAGDRWRVMLELTAETGARQSEVLGLTWGDVDASEGTVTFVAQLSRKGGERVPLKTKRARRCVEVTDALATRLREHKMASPNSGRHDLVFTTRSGAPLGHRNVARTFARVAESAGLADVARDGVTVERAPTMHDLRHTHASALIAAGWDIEEISARLGHADVATTMRTYVHEFEATRRSSDRRARLAAIYGTPAVEATVEAADASGARHSAGPRAAEVADLQVERSRRQ